MNEPLNLIDAGMLTLAEKYVPANYKRAMRFLMNATNGLTVRELAASMHVSKFGAEKIITILYEHKIVRICGWRRNTRGPITALYGMGSKPDARRPAKFTSAQKTKRWREKVQYSATRPDRDKSSKLSLAGQMKSIARSATYEPN